MRDALLTMVSFAPAHKFRFLNRASLYLFVLACTRAARLK